MCGIAGWVGDAAPEVMSTMLALLSHRGPDDSGTWADGGIALGMTRLAIIDLRTGAQPMTDAAGSLVIVFNGEIYNFRRLRAELEAQGHRFRTRSDTEVILGAYAEYGEGCVEHLRGMFAFAIWDRARRVLFLARDRLGKKPLYYWRQGGLFLFASEAKALLLHPAVSRSLDWQAFHHYMAFGYTPAERSMFAGIAKLPPAHTAIVRDGQLSLRRYWRLPAGAPASAPRPSVEDAAALVRSHLREAVRLRLESDVPLGVFLSGGVDSSAIVATMREVTGGRITTFSVGFGRAFASYDELPYARLVAERFATEHHEEVLEPKVAELLPTIVRHFDEPFADSSAVPTFVVAQATARHVKVALSGIGGDETFGGYPRYLGVRASERYARLPWAVRHGLRTVAPRLVPESRSSRNLGDWVRRFVAAADAPMADRMSMANSLELRAPFCDHHLIEASLTIPPATKIPGRRLKGLLKSAFASILPAPVLAHRKQGFMIPLGDWLAGDLRGTMEELLAPEQVRARGLFEAAEVERLKAEHLAGTRTHADRLWALMMTEVWIREYLDQRGAWALG